MDYCAFFVAQLHAGCMEKKCPKVSQNGAITPLSPPPYGGSCFSMLRQSVFVVWLVILFLLVHDEVNMRSTYKDGRSFIFRGWSAARLAGEHPPKSAPIVISSLSDF